MKLYMRMVMFSVVLALFLMISACGGGGSPTLTAGSSTLGIGSDGDSLNFKPNALTVSAGQQVTITVKDNSSSLQHNWVLINGDVNVARKVATAGLTAGADKGYLISDPATIIAHSPLLSAGQTADVTFTAPAAGTYIFICTVPAHFPQMQGVLTVNEH
ncbi:MAG: plastocyanin/azurin family copper-binding protein [Chloroflexales bacterium]